MRRVALAVVLLLAARSVWAQSCAMCGSSFGQNDPVTRAFSWSILFLMATPYTIVGLIGAYLYFTYRRSSRRPRANVVSLARPSAEDGQGDLA
jgi:hypothetical protein